MKDAVGSSVERVRSRLRIYIVANGRQGEDGEGEEVACDILVAKEDLAEDAVLVLQAAAYIPPGGRSKDEQKGQLEKVAIHVYLRLDEVQSGTNLVYEASHHVVNGSEESSF